jgi:hypothetical protein
LAIGEGLAESGDKLAAENTSQHLSGEEEAVARVDPALVIGGKATGRNDVMDMGMMFQLLIPTVEHAEEADFGAEMAGIARHFQQGLGACPDQEIVDDLLVLQGQRGEPPRKGEDDMDVGGRQKFAAARLQPAVASGGLTLGAVPISARVVRDGAIPAAGTLIAMPAERGGAATLDGRQDLAVLGGQPGAAAFDEFLPCHADEIGHLQGWPVHLGVSRGLVFLPRG